MEIDVLNSLQTIGLPDKEASVYAALLATKKGTALTVAQAAGIKRPTAYLVLELLKQKKLVAITKFRGVKDYRALPLEHLKSYVRQQKKLADKYLPTIQKLYDSRQQKLRLRVYNNLSDVKTLLEKSLREKAAIYIIGDENKFIDNLGLYWQFFIKRSRQLNMSPKFKMYKGTVNLLLWSDKVAFIKFTGDTRVFGFKNALLHDYYQKVWNLY